MTTWTYGADDYNLATFGKVTLIDDYLGMSRKRGSNQIIPYQHGTVFVPKYYDERTLVFGIAVIAESAELLETTFDTMHALFALRTEQTLTQTREDTTVRTAQASVSGGIDVERVSDKIARVTFEFLMSKPYFVLNEVIADNTITINTNPKAMTVTNPGTFEERNPTTILTGPLENTVMTNSKNGNVLTYTGIIASPRVVTISTNSSGEYIAVTDLGVNVIGNITHSGSAALMVIDVGDNVFSIADDEATTGTVKVTFSAPFI